jgi:phenylalanyl-tRNA synthetase beta chain
VLLLEWDLDALLEATTEAEAAKKVGVLSPYAPVHEDLALVVDEAVPAVEVLRTCWSKPVTLWSREWCSSTSTAGRRSDLGKKSLAFSLSYQAPDRSLSDRDVTKVRGRLIKTAEKALGAKLRGG